MAETEVVPDLYRLAFVPGLFQCPKCSFQLSRQTMNVANGTVGTTEKDRESEPCPNDGTMMVHVTYQELCQTLDDRLRSEFDRIEKFVHLLRAASHCCRSYQYGNGAPDLAKSLADAIDAAVANERQ